MTRKFTAALTALAATAIVTAISGTGCKSGGVGDPCIPEAEYSPTFLGFNPEEVNVESKSFQCLTRLCLVNHFQGRVSCPYGQDPSASHSDGNVTSTFACNGKETSTSPNDPCCLPGVDTSVVGAADCPSGNCTTPPSGAAKSEVLPQCKDRTADKAVYCSCRCANVDGKTDDGAVYCGCPDGFQCTQLVASIGVGNSGLTGAYCIKKNTTYAKATSCSDHCDPTAKNCGSSNTAQQ